MKAGLLIEKAIEYRIIDLHLARLADIALNPLERRQDGRSGRRHASAPTHQLIKQNIGKNKRYVENTGDINSSVRKCRKSKYRSAAHFIKYCEIDIINASV